VKQGASQFFLWLFYCKENKFYAILFAFTSRARDLKVPFFAAPPRFCTPTAPELETIYRTKKTNELMINKTTMIEKTRTAWKTNFTSACS